jgi:hypothetical protein
MERGGPQLLKLQTTMFGIWALGGAMELREINDVFNSEGFRARLGRTWVG